MQYVTKQNGQITGGPYPLTNDRTASPNTDWKAEQLALHGFELVSDPVDPVRDFNVIQFQGDLANVAVAGQFTMADPVIEFAPLNTYATNKDFTGMAGYLQWRLALGKVEQSDVDVVKGILQGVVI